MGYQVIEPRQLGTLYGQQKYFPFAVAFFYWLIEQLEIELKDQLVGVQIEVIQFVHHVATNRYPCLGIHYDHLEKGQDLGPLVEATIDRLLRDHSMLELVSFIGADGKDWNAITAEIMTQGKQ